MSKVIVIDTSVFIAALLSGGGASRKILRSCFMGDYQPIMGAALYLEYESVLEREKVFKKCPLTLKERNELLDAFLSVCRWTHIYYLWRPNLSDEGDNHILELAIAGKAEAIITHNVRDFLHGELLFPEIAILQPKQLLEAV